MTNTSRVVRIGCAAGFWGDSETGAIELVETGAIQYLVFDYLAEITMSLLTRARMKDPKLGYATDFVTNVMARILKPAMEKKIKIVANAGGVNPLACRDALEALIKTSGVDAKVAVVLGDDLSAKVETFRSRGTVEMFSGAALPGKLTSANAYLGARPIAVALDHGADIVITGRCVDSAVVLGPLIHEFGWAEDDFDLLSTGTLLGHLAECGCMGTGGVSSDWQEVEGWETMGFPIVECDANGTAFLTKNPGTGGRVTPLTTGEQLLYEIGDPRAYLLPDVTCDWTEVRLKQAGPDRVAITGARGTAPTSSLKVSATYMDGFRATTTLTIAGGDAALKARRVGAAIIGKCRRLLQQRNLGDFDETSIEVIGAEEMYGEQARPLQSREACVKIAVRHHAKDGIEIFSREIAPAITATAPGITGFFAGRPGTVPVVRLFSFLVDKAEVPIAVVVGNQTIPVALGSFAPGEPVPAAATPPAAEKTGGAKVRVPLSRIACARSGDKGDSANIGVLAREPRYFPLLREGLTADVVARLFGHYVEGDVRRFELPGIHALNFVLESALGGGGVASLRIDPQGKCFAPILLDMEIEVPRDLAVAQGIAAG